MDRSKVKTIAIVTLALVNLFFLSFIIIDTIADSGDFREEIELATNVLASEGIIIDPAAIHIDTGIRALRTQRDTAAEERIARAVLGTVERIPQGVIYTYVSSDNGTAQFYSAGDFEILLNEGVIPISGGTIRTVDRVLRSMGIDGIVFSHYATAGGEVVTVNCAYRGTAIFNNTIDFIFSENSLEAIRGRYVTGFELIENGTGISNIGTVLLRFLSNVRSGEITSTVITSLEAGYQFRPAGGIGEGIIVPAWLITTDTGRYIADCETGEIRVLS